MYVVGGNTQFLGGDLPEYRERTLAGFDGAGEHSRRAVFIDLDHRRTGVRRHGEADRIPHAGDAASALFHYRISFQPKRSAACSSESFTTTLCSTCPVGLEEPS